MMPPPCEACTGVRFRFLFRKEGHDFYRCRTCGLVRLHPQPSDEVLGQIYGSAYYDAWGMKEHGARVLALKKETFARHVFPHVKLAPGARVLDCGAAFGTLMEAAAERGWQPYGIELAAEAAAKIAARFGADRAFSGPFEAAAFPSVESEGFHALFMCDFIEHVRDPVAVLGKAASLLQSGGQLVLTTPDGGSPSCRAMGASWPHFKVEHLFYFGAQNIGKILSRAGLILDRVGPAHKVLNYDYLQHQFNTYPRQGITALFNALGKLLPRTVRSQPRSFSFGEFLAVAHKP